MFDSFSITITQALNILRDGDPDPALNFKGLLHESLVDVLTRTDGGGIIKAKV